MKKFIIALVLLSLTGCSTLRDWKVGTDEVPGYDPITRDQREAEKTAADYLARNVETPVEAVPVAQGLSNLMGAPIVPTDDTAAILRDLRKELAAQQKRLADLEEWISKNQGKSIEGSGWQPFKWIPGTWFLWIIGITAFIAIGGLPFLVMALRMSRATIRTLVRGVEDIAQSSPDTAKQIKSRLKQIMPNDQQLLIDKVKLQP